AGFRDYERVEMCASLSGLVTTRISLICCPLVTTESTHPRRTLGQTINHAGLCVDSFDVHADVLWYGLRDRSEDEAGDIQYAMHGTECCIGFTSAIRVQDHVVGEQRHQIFQLSRRRRGYKFVQQPLVLLGCRVEPRPILGDVLARAMHDLATACFAFA